MRRRSLVRLAPYVEAMAGRTAPRLAAQVAQALREALPAGVPVVHGLAVLTLEGGRAFFLEPDPAGGWMDGGGSERLYSDTAMG